MVLTFIAYSLIAGILASMTTNFEDYQQMQTPSVIVSLVGYYLAIFGGMFKGAILIKILSYVPFISAVLSPTLVIMGDATIVDLIISSAISKASFGFFLYLQVWLPLDLFPELKKI